MEDRRKYARRKAVDNAFAVSGGIPCSLIDVSEGGLGLKYSGDEPLPEQMTVDLMYLSRELVLNGIWCRKVSDEKVLRKTVFSYLTERRIGLEFIAPVKEMWEVLEEFVGTEN